MKKKPRSGHVRLLHLASLVVLGLGFVAVGPAIGQTRYVVEDLGALAGDSSSVAWAINANGDVVGWSTGQDSPRAFLYTNTAGMVALPVLPERPRTVARDINDAGVIVGTADAGGVDLGHAVLWSGGSIQDLGTLGTGSYSEGSGVNNLGQVVGSSYTNGGSLGVHAFLYTQAAGLVDLTPTSDTGYAKDINDAGQVTGYKTAFGGYHAFRWQAGTFEDLGVLTGFAHSFGWAINASGQVTGSSTSASGNSERLFRSIEGGGLQDLGGVGEHNVALGINASGQVVGHRGLSLTRALMYTDAAGLQDLNTLIDPSLGWVLLAANDINDAGQIVGHAFNNFSGQTHAVRLRPTTRPPGDFDGDGRADLLWRHEVSGENVVWYMNGTALTTGTFLNPAALADNNWRIVGTHDFNTDNQTDILWRHEVSGENALWHMNGATLTSGTFLTPSALADTNWKIAGTGDFNGDNKPDIAWHHRVSGQVAIWYMNGSALASGTFTAPSSEPDAQWRIVGVADFNGDGKPDLLWCHETTGEIRVWYMNNATRTSAAPTTPSSLSDTRWRIVAVADYNADGKTDIVWRHAVSGGNVVWFMNGAVMTSGVFTTPSSLPDTNWELVGPR